MNFAVCKLFAEVVRISFRVQLRNERRFDFLFKECLKIDLLKPWVVCQLFASAMAQPFTRILIEQLPQQIVKLRIELP
jgi:hypothetical protein